jgi:hypothetical protein
MLGGEILRTLNCLLFVLFECFIGNLPEYGIEEEQDSREKKKMENSCASPLFSKQSRED